jgi:hypothetical protein
MRERTYAIGSVEGLLGEIKFLDVLAQKNGLGNAFEDGVRMAEELVGAVKQYNEKARTFNGISTNLKEPGSNRVNRERLSDWSRLNRELNGERMELYSRGKGIMVAMDKKFEEIPPEVLNVEDYNSYTLAVCTVFQELGTRSGEIETVRAK